MTLPFISNLFLERSKSVPLEIHIRPGCTMSFLQSLRPHLPQMRVLNAVLNHSFFNATLSIFNNVSAPVLQSLTFKMLGPSPGPHMVILPSFQTDPSTTYLKLSGFALGENVKGFTNLVHLSLDDTYNKEKLCMNEFMNIMSSNPRLQTIRAHFSSTTRSSIGMKVSTPDLRAISLLGKTSIPILESLCLPAGCHLNISCHSFITTFPTVLPNSSTHLQNLSDIEKIHLKSKTVNGGILADLKGVGPNGSIEIKKSREPSIGFASLLNVFSHISPPFCVSSMQDLTMEGYDLSRDVDFSEGLRGWPVNV